MMSRVLRVICNLNGSFSYFLKSIVAALLLRLYPCLSCGSRANFLPLIRYLLE